MKPLIHEIFDSRSGATGALIDSFLALPDAKRRYIRVAAEHLTSAGQNKPELENAYDHLVRGFESLTKVHNLSSEDLIAGIDISHRAAVSAILERTSVEIVNLAQTNASRRGRGSRGGGSPTLIAFCLHRGLWFVDDPAWPRNDYRVDDGGELSQPLAQVIVLVRSRTVVPDERDDLGAVVAHSVVEPGVRRNLVDYLLNGFTRPQKLGLDDDLHRGDVQVRAGTFLSNFRQILFVIKIRENWGEHNPQQILDMVLVVYMPLAQGSVRCSWLGFARPFAQPSWNTFKQTHQIRRRNPAWNHGRS